MNGVSHFIPHHSHFPWSSHDLHFSISISASKLGAGASLGKFLSYSDVPVLPPALGGGGGGPIDFGFVLGRANTSPLGHGLVGGNVSAPGGGAGSSGGGALAGTALGAATGASGGAALGGAALGGPTVG